MRRSSLSYVVLVTVFLISCGHDRTETPIVTPTSTPTKSTNISMPEEIPIIFTPALPSRLGKTLVYFLIDNSTPVTSAARGCGELGSEVNLYYVDFMTANILTPLISDSHSLPSESINLSATSAATFFSFSKSSSGLLKSSAKIDPGSELNDPTPVTAIVTLSKLFIIESIFFSLLKA